VGQQGDRFRCERLHGARPVKEIVSGSSRGRLAVGVYFSVIDWHHPDFPVQKTGLPHPLKHERNKGLPDPDQGRVMSRYVDFMHQTSEGSCKSLRDIGRVVVGLEQQRDSGRFLRAGPLMAMGSQGTAPDHHEQPASTSPPMWKGQPGHF